MKFLKLTRALTKELYVKTILSALLFMSINSAMAITPQQQQEALVQLNVAQSEIKIVSDLLPGFLRKTIGKNLENALERINYAQKILARVDTQTRWHCSVEATWDGMFDGYGATEIEARNEAMRECKRIARNNGLFCKQNTMTCNQEAL